jgi:maltooligosyltrehalose trehalohydrolase
MLTEKSPWHLDMGANLVSEGIRFRVWAPRARRVEVEIQDLETHFLPMELDTDGTWTTVLRGHGAGLHYKYRLNGAASFPDPYARSQPLGVHGPSEVVDPAAFGWHDTSWHGLDLQGLVIYECHLGTATPDGTCDALIDHLDRLVQLGIGAIELLPVAAFPGRRNWGYDGVYAFAVSANYGGPEALKRLVDEAHQRGLGVILDVVYNHFGPEGCYLRQFAPHYFSSRYRTPWGEALNYDGPHSRWMRQLAIDNACYWLHEYHLDGLRLDAASRIFDSSQPHVLQELTQTVRASLPAERHVVLIAETSENDVRYLLAAEAGGHGFDAVWADDFYWSLRRYLTGDHEGRFQDYQGTLAEVARTINQGFLYEGEWSSYLQAPRGTPARHQPARQFQYCIQHHDHVGNRAFGERLHHQLDLDRYRVASTLLLLLPYTPLIFMGQEFAASTPFLFFTDHSPALGRQVAVGRRREFSLYAAFADPQAASQIPDPQAEDTFRRSKLPLEELTRSPGVELQQLYRELLQLRQRDPVLSRQDRRQVQAQQVTPDVLLITWQDEHTPRVLLANFGVATTLPGSAWRDGLSPSTWQVLLDTQAPRFGGQGEPVSMPGGAIQLPACTAVVLAPA